MSPPLAPDLFRCSVFRIVLRLGGGLDSCDTRVRNRKQLFPLVCVPI